MGLDSKIKDACSKTKSTFFNLINHGINESGFCPFTSKHLYTSVVLPKALYGSELWSCMSVILRKLKMLTDFVSNTYKIYQKERKQM